MAQARYVCRWMGPGDPGENNPQSTAGQAATTGALSLNLELLSNELPPEEHMDTHSVVNFNDDLRDIAVRRCMQLQELAQGRAATWMASHGGG